MTREREQRADPERLWADYRALGDVANRNRLAEYYLPVVERQAAWLSGRLPGWASAEEGDLAGAGAIGLLKAIGSYDPARGCKFTTYCVPCVRGAMLDWLRETDWVPRLERDRQRRGEVEPVRVQSVRLDRRGEPVGLPHRPSGDERRRQRADLRQLVTCGLTANERIVVLLHYYEGMTFGQVGGVIGASESRVSQLHRDALAQLRAGLAGRADEFTAAV